MTDSVYYYADENKKPVGPYSLGKLQELATQGVIKPGTKVIRKGAKTWMPYSQLPDELKTAPAVIPRENPVGPKASTEVVAAGSTTGSIFSGMSKPAFFGLLGALGCLLGGLLGEVWLLPFKGDGGGNGAPSEGNGTQSTGRSLMVFSPEIQKRLESTVAGEGAIEIALIWENTDDLDLHCKDPKGNKIYFGEKTSPTGGWLDVDMNAGTPFTNKPVEHIFWKEGETPMGTYQVSVNHYSARDNNPLPTEFTVAIKAGGKIKEFKLNVNADSTVPVHTFEITEKGSGVVGGSSEGSVLNALVLGVWTALLAVCLALMLVAGQNHLMNRPLLEAKTALSVIIGGAMAGLVSGAASQYLFSILELALPAWAWLQYLGRILGWTLLGGILGAGMGWFIPNLSRVRSGMAGMLGGLVGAAAFLIASAVVADILGRLAGVLILGLAIGLMVALVEQLTRRAWLEVHWSRLQSSTVNLGETPVTIGGGSDDIRVPGVPAGTLSIVLSDGRVVCTRQPDGQKTPLKDNSTIKLGKVRLVVRAQEEE